MKKPIVVTAEPEQEAPTFLYDAGRLGPQPPPASTCCKAPVKRHIRSRLSYANGVPIVNGEVTVRCTKCQKMAFTA